MEVHFRHDLSGDEIVAAIARLERRIRERCPLVHRVFLKAAAPPSPPAHAVG
jgi:hypothetical protein